MYLFFFSFLLSLSYIITAFCVPGVLEFICCFAFVCSSLLEKMSSSVILDSASKWSLWFSELQSIAALGGVWPYLDPHLDEGVQIPSCPAQPVVADIRHRATNVIRHRAATNSVDYPP